MGWTDKLVAKIIEELDLDAFADRLIKEIADRIMQVLRGEDDNDS